MAEREVELERRGLVVFVYGHGEPEPKYEERLDRYAAAIRADEREKVARLVEAALQEADRVMSHLYERGFGPDVTPPPPAPESPLGQVRAALAALKAEEGE